MGKLEGSEKERVKEIRLVRRGSGEPWGFTLHGGCDYRSRLSIRRVSNQIIFTPTGHTYSAYPYKEVCIMQAGYSR